MWCRLSVLLWLNLRCVVQILRCVVVESALCDADSPLSCGSICVVWCRLSVVLCGADSPLCGEDSNPPPMRSASHSTIKSNHTFGCSIYRFLFLNCIHKRTL